MLLFIFSNPLKNHIKSYINETKGIHFECIFQNVYRYIDHLFKNIIHKDIQLTILFNLVNNDYNDFEAFTEINECDHNKNPTYSTIYLTKSFLQNTRKSSKKYIYYVILHECIHALGIMYSNKTKWKTFLNKDETAYIYNSKPSIAINKYKLLKQNHIIDSIPLQLEECNLSDKHHLFGIKDVFSSPLFTNVSPVTIGLLYDYYHS